MNNAAWAKPGPTLSNTPEDIAKAFEIAVYGPIYLIQATVPHMPKGGRIINIGTVASKIGLDAMPLYSASKAAMDALTFAMAREVSGALGPPPVDAWSRLLTCLSQLGQDKGITINTVSPGPVITDALPPGVAAADAIKDWLVSLTRAEARPGTVEDVADIVLFVASEKSRWLTGQVLSATGGIIGG